MSTSKRCRNTSCQATTQERHAKRMMNECEENEDIADNPGGRLWRTTLADNPGGQPWRTTPADDPGGRPCRTKQTRQARLADRPFIRWRVLVFVIGANLCARVSGVSLQSSRHCKLCSPFRAAVCWILVLLENHKNCDATRGVNVMNLWEKISTM